MRKLLLGTLLLLSISMFSQEFTTSYAQKWFKENYVDVNFKDPYSYELLKIKVDTITLSGYLLNLEKSITLRKRLKSTYQEDLDKLPLDNKIRREGWINTIAEQDKIIEDLIYTYNQSTEIYNKTTIECLKEPRLLLINIDCHSNNSYGNPVLGRYRFNFDNVSKKFDTPVQIN